MKKKYKSRLWTAAIALFTFIFIFILAHQNPPQKKSEIIVPIQQL